MRQQRRPHGIRVLNVICAVTLLAATVWLFRGGVDLVASLAAGAALMGLATPAVRSAEGLWDALTGTLEAIVDGISGFVEMIVGLIEAILGILADLFG